MYNTEGRPFKLQPYVNQLSRCKPACYDPGRRSKFFGSIISDKRYFHVFPCVSSASDAVWSAGNQEETKEWQR